MFFFSFTLKKIKWGPSNDGPFILMGAKSVKNLLLIEPL
jgi:hypothetical protein